MWFCIHNVCQIHIHLRFIFLLLYSKSLSDLSSDIYKEGLKVRRQSSLTNYILVFSTNLASLDYRIGSWFWTWLVQSAPDHRFMLDLNSCSLVQSFYRLVHEQSQLDLKSRIVLYQSSSSLYRPVHDSYQMVQSI